jgi:hypothetical protein
MDITAVFNKEFTQKNNFIGIRYASTKQTPKTNSQGPTPNMKKAPENQRLTFLRGGLDGTRTRDPMRDRHVF